MKIASRTTPERLAGHGLSATDLWGSSPEASQGTRGVIS